MKHGRLEWLDPAGLRPDQEALYDAIANGDRSRGIPAFDVADDAGRLHGPFNAMLVAPIAGDALQRLGSAIRFGTTMSDRAREIAILLVASAEKSEFEWYAHGAVGRRVGLSEAELAELKVGRCPSTVDEYERQVFGVVADLLTTGDLSDAQHERAVGALGVQLVVELVTLVGYYRCLSLALRVWRVPLPDGVSPSFAASP